MLLPLLLALFQEPGSLAVPPASVVDVPRHEAEVRVDGRLDEPVWSDAATLTGFVQYEPVDGRPAEEQTEVLVWYSPDAIHFGVIARDSRPEAVRATRADRDAIDNDDHVVLYLDTFLDRRRAYFFSVNPFGVQQDGVRTEGAQTPGRMMGGSTDRNPDFLWESEGRLTDDGWVVEVRPGDAGLEFLWEGVPTAFARTRSGAFHLPLYDWLCDFEADGSGFTCRQRDPDAEIRFVFRRVAGSDSAP